MPTLHREAATESAPPGRLACPIESGLHRLAPALTRVAAETAGAFFCAEASLGSPWETPRLPDQGLLHCSQKNVGEKYELICNLSAEKAEWDRLFPPDTSEHIRMDAYCELANCICGSLLADAGFSYEFGFLLPCVPCSGAARIDSGMRSLRGAFRLSGAWVHFSFTVLRTAAVSSPEPSLIAAA